ncbi:hypothetical protein [Lysinibacillus yapensis]|nr:hypothetical protein [Lysinibacillus yapensis]
MEKEKLVAALKEIAQITQGLTEFNPTYEKIYKITQKVLEEKE